MASLPSFVELMASLGLDSKATSTPQSEQLPSSPALPDSPRMRLVKSPARASSNPSLRETATRQYASRYSPYSPAFTSHRRRGSQSSISSSSDFESSPLSPSFPSPTRPTLSRSRRYRNKLTINTYGSSSDINGETPISTYVRRKSPNHSPTSPNFNPDSGYESSSPPMPFSIPSLPMLLPHSASSESFPNTPTEDSDSGADIAEGHNYYRFIRRRTGTRISTPPRSARSEHYPRRKSIVDLALAA